MTCMLLMIFVLKVTINKYYSLQFLRDRCGITKEGVSLLDLSTGAESIGLRTLAVKCLRQVLGREGVLIAGVTP